MALGPLRSCQQSALRAQRTDNDFAAVLCDDTPRRVLFLALGTVEAVVDAVGDGSVSEDGGKAALACLDDALVLPTSGILHPANLAVPLTLFDLCQGPGHDFAFFTGAEPRTQTCPATFR